MKRNALLIGGSGFLGRHTARRLTENGWTVTVLDLPGRWTCTPTSEAAPFRALEGSVTRREDVDLAFAAAEPNLVLQLAAYSTNELGLVPSGEQNPSEAVSVNVVGLVNILESSRKFDDCRVVLTSSTTVLGPAAEYTGQVDENALLAPASVYAATKVLAEQLVRTYRRHHGVDAVALRPTLVWGPGIQYRGVQSAMGDMIEAAAHGAAISTPGNSELWDLIYVTDAAEAIVAVAESESPPPVLTASGYVASVNDVYSEVLRQVPEARIALKGESRPLGFPLVTTNAIDGLGFRPQFDLTASVADFLETERRTAH